MRSEATKLNKDAGMNAIETAKTNGRDALLEAPLHQLLSVDVKSEELR
jgi:hypothetical protein